MNKKTIFAIVLAVALIGVIFAGCASNSAQMNAQTTTNVASGNDNTNTPSGQNADSSNLTFVTADDTNLSDIV